VPQSAAVRDNEALAEVLAQQQSAALLPVELLADTIYGSDANVTASAALGVELVSPVPGAQPKPGGPSKHRPGAVERSLKARLQARRLEQETPQWQAKYRLRSGLEGVHHALDVVTGMKELRVRGAQAVRLAVTLKVTGWNILAAAKIQARRARAALRRLAGGPSAGAMTPQRRLARGRRARCGSERFRRRFWSSRWPARCGARAKTTRAPARGNRFLRSHLITSAPTADTLPRRDSRSGVQ
jgi:hypothetical protein